MTLRLCGTGCQNAVMARQHLGPSGVNLMQHKTDSCRPPGCPSITALTEPLPPSLGTAQVKLEVYSLQVVLSTELVLARPFYGYHAEDRLFVKIKLYNPSQVNRIATLLQVSCCVWVLPPPACLAAQCAEGQACRWVLSGQSSALRPQQQGKQHADGHWLTADWGCAEQGF